jgi:hypothetical protein
MGTKISVSVTSALCVKNKNNSQKVLQASSRWPREQSWPHGYVVSSRSGYFRTSIEQEREVVRERDDKKYNLLRTLLPTAWHNIPKDFDYGIQNGAKIRAHFKTHTHVFLAHDFAYNIINFHACLYQYL